ncbi:MAG: beta-galactosidase [Bacteroidaceae bacterium]|nr:beta-galactosidase [Bacteroidaceae bacterium]
MKRFGIIILLAVCIVGVCAQNITDLAVMADRSATTEDLDDWTEGPAIPDSVFLHPDRIRYDSRCLQIEGKDMFLLSGTFHYFRTPEPLWRDRMEKIRAAGFNCVETYVPWNWHEREIPASPDDFSKVDLSELDRFLTLAEEVGLYAIVRPGPYICAEWSGGGFPQWIMQKRPEHTLHEVWLQSMDSTFLAWNDHWYDAVCRVVAPHQLTRKTVGSKGVVLVQVENEFNRIKWFPRSEKRAYLEHCAARLRRGGIDVPLISCWTDEARNATSGPLNGVIDMVNSYPRWQIRKGFGRLINQQLKSQPGKPLISGELQGGWSSDLSTPLSWDMDGQSPAQTQNITLYALQRGFCALNFYMLVGGTNFDDWAARNQTATYDFAAAIGEDGTLNERYYRLQALAEFIREHGTRIARSRIEPISYTTTDSLVELTVRRHPGGTRYLFVRTEDHTKPHKGQFIINNSQFTIDNSSTSEAEEPSAQMTIDFDLEPFGSRVAVLSPAGSVSGGLSAGTAFWFPREVVHTGKPAPHHLVATLIPQLANPVSPTQIHFTPLPQREGQGGGSSRHPLLYKVHAKTKHGGLLTISRVGKNQMNRTEADQVLAFADNQPLPICAETDTTISFAVPRGTRSLLFLYDTRGLHHHTNLSVEHNWQIVPKSIILDGHPVTLAYADLEREQASQTSTRQGNPHFSLFTADFSIGKGNHSLPLREGEGRGLWLRLRHTGNGFVYLNGHCLGRCYEAGPQSEYYLPECWINTDKPNVVAVSLIPSANGAEVKEMSLVSASINQQMETIHTNYNE